MQSFFQNGDFVFFALDFGQDLCQALGEVLLARNQQLQALNALLRLR